MNWNLPECPYPTWSYEEREAWKAGYYNAMKVAESLYVGEPVAWRYTRKADGQETLTAQPPDRVLFPDDYKIEPLYISNSTSTHTDHPLRHFDRTCPACLAEQSDIPRSPE